MIKSNLTNAYMMFVLDLADPSLCDRTRIEEKIGGKIEAVFDQQRSCDKAKRTMKDQFSKLLALYFNAFNGPDGLDYVRLEKELTKNRKHILRHLGKDKMNYLNLIVHLMSAVDGRGKKGLLFGAAS